MDPKPPVPSASGRPSLQASWAVCNQQNVGSSHDRDTHVSVQALFFGWDIIMSRVLELVVHAYKITHNTYHGRVGELTPVFLVHISKHTCSQVSSGLRATVIKIHL